MRKLVLLVLSCAVCACVVSTPPGPPAFETGWQFLDGVAAGPDDRVEPPVVKARTPAVYPIEARKQRLTGDVGLELTVDDDGRVVKAEVVQPLEPTMDEAALAAAQRWMFTPARLNGAPKASVVRDVVKFSIQ
ncbi:MAG TPA: energy transducer TonB [Gemmatimonadales bacterium]|nr:energy transducer TonB [Gemmatimonadales bacterium]